MVSSFSFFEREERSSVCGFFIIDALKTNELAGNASLDEKTQPKFRVVDFCLSLGWKKIHVVHACLSHNKKISHNTSLPIDTRFLSR